MFKQESLVDEMANLRKFALRLTKNVSDADDLLQATILRAMENRNSFQEDTNLFSWSSKIMFNIFACQYRRKRKFESQYDPAPYLEQITVGPTQEASADLAMVRKNMQRLSKDLHEILILVCIRGMRYEEVSRFLHIPIGTVRSRLSRARQQLRNLLETPQQSGIPYIPPHKNLPHKYQSAA